MRNDYNGKKRSELPDSVFGIPQERKYPMPDEKHTRSAIKLFNHVDPKYEEQLLPKDIPTFVIEAGSSLIWNRFATRPEYIFGINRFGMSGKSEDVAKYLKFDKATILASITSFLTKDVSIDII